MRKLLALALCLGCSSPTVPGDAGSDAAGDVAALDVVTLAITTINDVPTTAAPGAALKLAVVILQSDGTTKPLPTGTNVTWTAPQVVVAAFPSDGGNALPSLSPLAFFVQNPFRPDRSDYDGVLFIAQQGTTDNPNVTVTATVDGFGSVTAYIPARAPLVGDPDAGAASFVALKCAECHGPTGGGSPLNDAGMYTLQGSDYAFPAPPLNAGDGGTAADPTWTAGLYGLASQASIDNTGVSLRRPMPDFLGPNTAQTFADIYAFMRTQTQ
jgi:hypothetical protein